MKAEREDESCSTETDDQKVRAEEARAIELIRALRAEGFTLRGIRKELERRGVIPRDTN